MRYINLWNILLAWIEIKEQEVIKLTIILIIDVWSNLQFSEILLTKINLHLKCCKMAFIHSHLTIPTIRKQHSIEINILSDRRLLLPANIFLFYLNYFLAIFYAFEERASRSLIHCWRVAFSWSGVMAFNTPFTIHWTICFCAIRRSRFCSCIW